MNNKIDGAVVIISSDPPFRHLNIYLINSVKDFDGCLIPTISLACHKYYIRELTIRNLNFLKRVH